MGIAVVSRRPQKLVAAIDRNILPQNSIADYRAVAKEIGISDADMMVEEFRSFLAGQDIPTFNLGEVVGYMDSIAARDNPTGFGWHWCPVREKDGSAPLTFGRPSEDRRHFNSGGITPASDYYESHRFQDWNRGRGGWAVGMQSWGGWGGTNNTTVVNVETNVRVMQQAHDEIFHQPPSPPDWRTMPSPAYTRTLPLHALKKIALVERSFKSAQVIFLVTDFCTAPHIVVNPDPFLMAVIPNSAVAHGKGRFIIDVWDEPGFGIDKQIK